MEQKTINQNKFQTFLCIIALTLGVLVSAVLFSMPPVYAEENYYITDSNASNDCIIRNILGYTNSNSQHQIDTREYSFGLDMPGFYAIAPLTDGNSVYALYMFDLSAHSVSTPKLNFMEIINWNVDGKDTLHNETNRVNRILSFDVGSFNSTWTDPSNGITYENKWLLPFPVFDSVHSFENYCKLGDKSGLISEPEVPGIIDGAYTYIGFSINGKTARWTDTTERSHLKDQEVEEYTRITYGFAISEDQILNADNFIEYDQDFAVGEKFMKIPWSEIESNKKDGEFIRQVNFIPCYRVPGAFYLGKGVKVFFNSDGTVDKIEQVTIPSDSETIGNDISLIGFQYDNSFHAEWVDVWSNAVNKSAFDLDSGGQYLSLGIKAIYYDGSKADIDFYSLDRKKLTWDKAFSDFKENNGSPIKSLYFTPYTKTGVNNPWNKGNSIVVNFDENGNTSSSFDTGDDGTVHLDDFKLTGVVWNKPFVQNGTITWTGTTPNSDLLFVPDSDTLVTATYPRYDVDLNTSYETWSTTTIGKGSMKVNVDYLIDYYKNSELAWNGEMWLTPCYKKGGVLYVGDPVIINCLKGTVSDIVVDKDSGKAEQVDKTNQNKSDEDSILNVGNQFYSIINSLIGSLQQLPALLTAIFGFLPSSIVNLLYASFAVIIICRILGR